MHSKAAVTTRPRFSRQARRKAIAAYLMILPWIIGFIWFTAGPMVFSLVLTFTNWDIIQPPTPAGFHNFAVLFRDPLFWKSLYNSAYYTVFFVPLSLMLALAMALLLNRDLPGIALFRTLYYLPNLTPTVAMSVLWLWIFNPSFGILNIGLGFLHLPQANWLNDPHTVKWAFIIMGLWTVGTTMIIFLAGLQGIPKQLYEAAQIDGAGRWNSFLHVTIPMLSPMIFFNLLLGIIGGLQAGFTTSYVMTKGGPDNASLFYDLYLYEKAFEELHMGYGSALAWVLFIIILVFTLFQFYLSKKWVYYEGDPSK